MLYLSIICIYILNPSPPPTRQQHSGPKPAVPSPWWTSGPVGSSARTTISSDRACGVSIRMWWPHAIGSRYSRERKRHFLLWFLSTSCLTTFFFFLFQVGEGRWGEPRGVGEGRWARPAGSDDTRGARRRWQRLLLCRRCYGRAVSRP